MDIESNWNRIKTHRGKLSNQDIWGLSTVLFFEQEEWLERKLKYKEDEAMAVEFLSCLGQHGSRKAAAVLLRQLENREEMMQVAATEGLKHCPMEYTLEPLTRMMLRQNQSAIKAGEVMLSYGAPGADVLWELWFSQDNLSGLKAQILRLLTEAEDQRAERLAFLAFLSEEEELLREALITAEKLGAVGLWGNVAGCLTHPSWRFRGRAVKLLGQWGIAEALVYLLAMGEDPDPWVEEERQKAIAVLETVNE